MSNYLTKVKTLVPLAAGYLNAPANQQMLIDSRVKYACRNKWLTAGLNAYINTFIDDIIIGAITISQLHVLIIIDVLQILLMEGWSVEKKSVKLADIRTKALPAPQHGEFPGDGYHT